MIKRAKELGAMGIATVSSLLLSGIAYAQSTAQTVKLTDPLGGSETFASIATAVASFLFWDIALPLCTIMILVGAFQLITSAGDPEKVSKGRKTIMYAAIGFAIACICGGVTNIIKSFVTGS